jgi:hypothetical protein
MIKVWYEFVNANVRRIAMKWMDDRARFQARFDELSQNNIQGLITELNQLVGHYIANTGNSKYSSRNSDYKKIIDLTNKAEEIKNNYYQLNDDILKYLGNEARDNNLSGLLTENGEVQRQIQRLNKIQDEIKVDVESAVARDELLRSRNTNITPHQLYLLDRPVRRGIIPYLWVLSILFIGVGLVIFYMMAPYILPETDITVESIEYIPIMIFEFISNKTVLVSLLISALIVILFLSLKIAGLFGR